MATNLFVELHSLIISIAFLVQFLSKNSYLTFSFDTSANIKREWLSLGKPRDSAALTITSYTVILESVGRVNLVYYISSSRL